MADAPILTIVDDSHLLSAILPALLREAAEWGGVVATITVHHHEGQWTGRVRKYDEHIDERYVTLFVGDRDEAFELRQIKTLRLH